MNLILFHPEEIAPPLPLADPRARHILDVLRRSPGESFDVGLVNGPRGRATLVAQSAGALTLEYSWGPPPPPPDALTLVLGLPRPQTARDILRDATTLGVAAIHFVATEKSEPSYAQSTLWREGEWRRHVLAGAAQAFTTQIPDVTATHSLGAALALLAPHTTRLALDNYEASRALRECPPLEAKPLALALGPERGWGSRDRAALRAAGFTLVHLGSRVLRLETAVIAALALVKSARGTL